MAYNGYAAAYIFNAVAALFWIAFLGRVLDGLKLSRPITIVLATVVHSLCWCYEAFLVPPSVLRALMTPIQPLILAFLFMHGKALKKVFAVFSMLVISCAVELLFTPFSEGFIQDEVLGIWADPRAALLGAFMLPAFALALFTSSFAFTRSKNLLKGKELLVFLAFPVTQFLTLICIETQVYGLMRSSYSIVAALIFIIFAVTDILLYKTMVKTEERVQLETANELLLRQLDNQLSHYAALTEQYDNIRAMRHDINNHLSTVKLLLREGSHEEASEYAEQLLPMQEHISKIGECKNPVVDAFLYDRIRIAESKGIEVKTEIALPQTLSVSNTDLIVLFANIMDNAIEACSELADACIDISARLSKGYLVVTEKNPAAAEVGQKQRRIPELERGTGFRIIGELAERYNGSFEHRQENGLFELSVVLNVD